MNYIFTVSNIDMMEIHTHNMLYLHPPGALYRQKYGYLYITPPRACIILCSKSHSSPNHVFKGPCFVHWGSVMLEQKRTFPKLFSDSWNHKTAQSVMVCWSIENSVNISHTLHSHAGNVLLAFAKPRLIHQTARQRTIICHSTEYKPTAPESSGNMLYTTWSGTWHCTLWCKACMQCLGHRNQCHEAPSPQF